MKTLKIAISHRKGPSQWLYNKRQCVFYQRCCDKTIPSKMVEADLTSWTKEFYFYSKYVKKI